LIAGGSVDDGANSPEPSVFDEHFYKIVTMSAAVIIGLATTLYHWLEDWSWVDSLYFSVVAVTTVGFGDLVPTKDGTKLLTVAYVLAGIGIITTFINLRLQRNRHRRFNSRPNER
jgi:hypothetical protein